MNTLSDSKYFSIANKRYGYSAKLFSKVNWNDYKIPKEFMDSKVENLRGLKYPLVNDVINYYKKGKLILIDLNESLLSTNKMGNLHINYMFPKSVFNFNAFDTDSSLICFVDLSYKGKYLRVNREVTFYDISDTHLYHMMAAGYIQLKLAENPKVSSNQDFYLKICEAYALILTKIVDNMFPIISTSPQGANKLHFLTLCFAIQNMFGVNKDQAVVQALKSRFVVDKKSVQEESIYIRDQNLNFMDCDNQTKFPIDKYCEIICSEFEHIDDKQLTADLLVWKFTDRMTRNAAYAIDSAPCFINMIYFGKNNMMMYNDLIIKQYLQLSSTDLVNEVVKIIKND